MKLFTFEPWMTEGKCNFTKICPSCILDKNQEIAGNPLAPIEVIIEGHRAAMDFRPTAAKRGYRIAPILPGKEPLFSQDLETFLALAARSPEDSLSLPKARDIVSIGTNGSLLSRRFDLLRRYPLDTLRISGNITPETGLHQGSPIEEIMQNARVLFKVGGCRRIVMATNFTGNNYDDVLDLYLFFRETVRSYHHPFVVQAQFDWDGSQYRPRPTEEEVDVLIDAFVDLEPQWCGYWTANPPIVIELEPSHYETCISTPDRPFVLPNDELEHTTILYSDERTLSNVAVTTFNPKCPLFLGIREDGYLISLADTKYVPKTTKYGYCSSGRVTEVLHELMRA